MTPKLCVVLQLHQFPEVCSSEVWFVFSFTGYRKLSLAVGGGDWGRPSSITWLLRSPKADESPEGSGSSLTLNFPSIRKSSCLAWHLHFLSNIIWELGLRSWLSTALHHPLGPNSLPREVPWGDVLQQPWTATTTSSLHFVQPKNLLSHPPYG